MASNINANLMKKNRAHSVFVSWRDNTRHGETDVNGSRVAIKVREARDATYHRFVSILELRIRRGEQSKVVVS